MALEILRGKEYTEKSDVYSFGIIMNEIISIIPPFNNEPHDHYLTLDICSGKRPKIRNEKPKFLKKLIQKCWDALPENRPTSKKDLYLQEIQQEKRQGEELPSTPPNKTRVIYAETSHQKRQNTSPYNEVFSSDSVSEPIDVDGVNLVDSSLQGRNEKNGQKIHKP
ncbi:kinase-like domain-containing protein [Glomus cerebriforme]|uniref:Kinase-like domain-containing protein n=1 Tax=Glomus cerebriforme TaxID=658196 RepID=A0A397RYN2_9GLOM|nr:kinase-like domain-containing protein [Glomus cerebriforme]